MHAQEEMTLIKLEQNNARCKKLSEEADLEKAMFEHEISSSGMINHLDATPYHVPSWLIRMRNLQKTLTMVRNLLDSGLKCRIRICRKHAI
ncbi:MAG: hypothetical protein EBR33_12725 [Synechococcaceae bacterium WB4_1_0192]|nr:hypothetical protein [Synechococcaceae bacterium WB4_1_0192]